MRKGKASPHIGGRSPKNPLLSNISYSLAMTDKIRIIIADDHPIVRQGLRRVIEREADLEIAAEAGDGETALNFIVSLQPDVVVLDVDMPKLNGFEVLEKMQARQIQTRAILLTVHNEEEFFTEALRLGAQAYILKDCAIEDVVTAVRAVLAGRNYVSQELNSYLFRQHRAAPRPALSQLTPTERQILKLIAEYKTNKEIGDTLFISPLTVKTHRRNISQKLDIEGNHALMKFALENKSLL